VARNGFWTTWPKQRGRNLLAHSLQCARCHDHKFDPVPTRDYYSCAGCVCDDPAQRAAPRRSCRTENTALEEKKFLELRHAGYLATLQRLDEKLVRNATDWFREKGADPAQWNAAIAQAQTQDGARGAKAAAEFEGVFNIARGIS